MRTTVVDDAILVVAQRQRGAFSRAQAFTSGASERFINRRLVAGDWIKLDTAVYALPSFAGTWERQLWASLLGTTGSSVAGLSASVVYELPDFRPGRPEILIPPTVTTRSKLAVVHKFAGALVTTYRGFPITTIAQTLCDITMLASPWRVERAMDTVLLGKRATVAELRERLDFYIGAHRHGIVLFRGLVTERSDAAWVPPESELEAVGIDVLRRVPGLHLTRQVPMRWRTTGAHRFDLVDIERKLIIELDGRSWHSRMQDFDRDRWKDNEAVAEGWRLLRFTWVHMTCAPDAVVDLATRTLALPPLPAAAI